MASLGVLLAGAFAQAALAQVASRDASDERIGKAVAIAQAAGTPVDRIGWDCADARSGLLGELRADRLCLPRDVRAAIAADASGIVVVALALARANAATPAPPRARTTIGGVLAGTLAATIDSHVRSRDAANPNPLRYPEGRSVAPGEPLPPEGRLTWQARGIAWAERAGVCRAAALDFLRRLARDVRLEPVLRQEAEALLRQIARPAFPPQPCAAAR